MGDRRHAIIAGGGIAGLTCALTLAAREWQVTIAEKAERLSEIGAGIQITPNALSVLAGLGLDSALEAVAEHPAEIVLNGGSASRNVRLPTAPIKERFGRPYLVVHRADLQKLLLLAVDQQRTIRLITDTVVSEVLTRPAELAVKLRTGSSTDVAQADVLIGADGVWSDLRGRIAPGVKAKPVGHTAWRAMIPTDIASDFVDVETVNAWFGRGAHVVHYPVAQGSAVNVVALVQDDLHYQGWSTAGEIERIRRYFVDWPEPLFRLLGAAYSWQKFSVFNVDPTIPWTGNRIGLIGDAAHAMVPFIAQGAAMAMEDAATIAHHLSETNDINAALAAYEAERRPRIVALEAAARRTGQIYEYGGLMAFGRDVALRFGGQRLVRRQTDWIYAWTPPAA